MNLVYLCLKVIFAFFYIFITLHMDYFDAYIISIFNDKLIYNENFVL